jgi:hypothetical protein
MNVVINAGSFQPPHVYFQESVKNTIMDDSNFIRICYSNELFALNGILLKLHIRTFNVEKYFNKYKCSYDVNTNREEIAKVAAIERQVLQRLGLNKKRANYRITEQLNSGNIKLFTDNINIKIPDEYILKISGIWETETDFGLTYKFMDIARQD